MFEVDTWHPWSGTARADNVSSGEQHPQHLQRQRPHPHPAFRQLFSSTQQRPRNPEHQPTFSTANYHLCENSEPRKPLTSIAGSSRCLWPPDSTYLTMSDAFKERTFQHRRIGLESTVDSQLLTSATPPVLNSQKNHIRCDSHKDTGDCMQDLQPRRKARRVMEGPYFKEKNHRMVAGHVRKLIQGAVEDGVGELDLSNLELTDLPSDICDLNYAIVYNERGSFSLSKNRLKLFLSSNHFTSIPMDVFTLSNLSVLSIRNNNIEALPPEIGLLVNLVELSVGGNLLKVLPSQVALLPKLSILTVHPNSFMLPPEPEAESSVIVNPPADLDQPQLFHDDHDTGNAGISVLIPEQNQIAPTGLLMSVQHSTQPLLISPPASPPMQQIEEIDMTLQMLGHDVVDVGSLSFTTAGSVSFDADTMDEGVLEQGPYLLQGSTSSPSSSAAAAAGTEASRDRNVGSSLSDGVDIKPFPPHKITRSRFPTLLILAGNALLNYMDAHETPAITTSKATNDTQDRPRKDSNILMNEDGWRGDEHEVVHHIPRLSGDALDQHPQLKKTYVFKEETIKLYLTPYLFDNFKRARTNNRCAGCQRIFWKPCKVTVVWQDLLGQTKIPIEWKGCGIKGCPGVSAGIWSAQGSLSSSPPSLSEAISTMVPSISPTGSPAAIGSGGISAIQS
ncbi:hypothetical protein BGZ65_002686 [Modicella reniformis]|uniref:Uncharacterized protein n=1 Tax=Modicella reniformis TaxID=1440133 RepID=A0A9P6SME0_9FUNG|nr:hypothetical protein BGZ65_002686 [Modicella reniformis]